MMGGMKGHMRGEVSVSHRSPEKAAHAYLASKSIKTTGKFHGKSNRLGGGGRFAQLAAKAKASGARNPGAVAAAIGRKKYGAKKFAKMSAAGRRA